MQSSQQPAIKNIDDNLFEATIATQRFALGAQPNEIEKINTHAKQWLLKQLQLSPAVRFDQSLPNSITVLNVQSEFRKAKKAFKKLQSSQSSKQKMDNDKGMLESDMMVETKSLNNAPKNPNRAIYKQLIADTLKQSIESENSFNWRCLDFFSNHFSVTAKGQVMTGLAPTLEREAIAPHLFNYYDEMLLAVCQHPAMLIYLNNEISIGPSTRFAKKNRGLNENLAREILELHTLGINGGYQQRDVTELAKGLTGWSVARPGKDKQQGFIYRHRKHEPGIRVLLGKNYPQQGITQAQQMLKDLANHPTTARFICTKIVQSYISDQAPQELVTHLVQHWLASNGHLKTVFTALINHPLAWQVTQQKYKTPREYVISTYRALAIMPLPIRQVQKALTTLGQAPFKAGSPAGYSSLQQDWDGANALMARINWASQLVEQKRLASIDIKTLITTVFGHSLSTHSYQMITRAESRQQALTLLLLCPEFLRR